MIDEWESIARRPAPRLVLDFAEDSDAALDGLLTGRAGSVAAQRGPAGVLGPWLSMFQPGSAFAAEVDRAVARRVEIEWALPKGGRVEARRRALRLARLCDVVSSSPKKLSSAAAELHARFAGHSLVLAPWSPSPSQDPLGRYLLAIARTQRHRGLAPFWFSQCRLPASVPVFRAEYAIAGLRGLPRRDEENEDEFPYEVASGLRILAAACYHAVDQARIDEASARRTVVSVAQVCMAAYPLGGWADELLADLDGWPARAADLLRNVAALDQRAVTEEALRRAFGGGGDLKKLTLRQKRGARAPGRRLKPVAGGDVRPLLKALSRGDANAVKRMERIIESERTRIEQSGEFALEFGGLLARASAAARATFPKKAVAWSEDALQWEPWDVRAWTIATAAYRAAGRSVEALDTAWRAQARFPFNSYVWTELGEALWAERRIVAAEAVLGEAIQRFPDQPPLISAYSELLIATGRAAMALPLLEEATERFEASEATAPLWAGLTAALISENRMGEARDVATKAVELVPDDRLAKRAAHNFDAFRRERKRRDAEFARKGAPAPGPDGTLFSVVAEARALREQARTADARPALDSAWDLLERNSERGANNPRVVAEVALLQTERGEAHAALAGLEHTPFRGSADASVALASTRARRAALGDGGDAEKPIFTPERLIDMTREMRDAAAANISLRPLEILTTLQATAALTDGKVLDAEREQTYARLMDWIGGMSAEAADGEPRVGEEDEDGNFMRRWSASVAGVLADVATSPPARVIADEVDRRAATLDGLQETFEHRLAAVS